ncbi:MAG: hypothetical protein HY344_01870 [Candidatus Levybacteria bacterium]|nr:hypothetical protein [Candidatus Levybacteria bacterium]
MTTHQIKQVEVINQIERQVETNSLKFSTVFPLKDYDNDPRICLTSIHLPKESLITKIQAIIDALKIIEPEYYYYSNNNFHMTIKNIRVVNDPPHFTKEDIAKAQKIFSKVVPNHNKFDVYFYRLLLFPNNLALVGTTDPEFDQIFLDLDKELNKQGIFDDKKYTNSQYFFSNMTLARFPKASDAFKQKVWEVSSLLQLDPYTVNSVALVTCNAVFKKRQIINTWELK